VAFKRDALTAVVLRRRKRA